jgi:hypothetical protein
MIFQSCTGHRRFVLMRLPSPMNKAKRLKGGWYGLLAGELAGIHVGFDAIALRWISCADPIS